MNIKILTLEKVNEKFAKEAILEYSKRLSRYCKLNFVEAKSEGQILNQVADKSYLILVNSGGDSITSEGLADKIADLGVSGCSDIGFLVMDESQVTNEIRTRADYHIAISRLEMDMNILMILVHEQVYRAFKIQKNETYHK